MKIRNSIIICTYNEVGNIKIAISDIQNNIPNSEIILVDDNSTDGTLREISEIDKSQNIKIIIRKKINDFTSGIFLMKRKLLDDVSILGYGHGDFFIEFLYNIEKKGFKVKEFPYVQKKDLEAIKSKSAPNILKFTYYGVKYILRIFITLLRRN